MSEFSQNQENKSGDSDLSCIFLDDFCNFVV